MPLKDEITKYVNATIKEPLSKRDGTVVPEFDNVLLGNDAVSLDATVLYADLDESTKLVDNYYDWFAAQVYKCFLDCSARIIKAEGGVIRSYDGDRVMGIFIGGTKNSNAVRCGLKINWAVQNIIKPAINARYPKNTYDLKHVVGIDTSKILAIRTGVKGDNDLAWIGRAANYAAKLSTLNESPYYTWITQEVYKKLSPETKCADGGKGIDIWEQRNWNKLSNPIVYRSSYWWPVS